MTILSPDVPDDEIQGQLEAVSGYVTAAGGQIIGLNRESPWGRRRLAYAIRHNGRDVRDGYYTLFHFRIEPGRVVDIEREIKLNDQIIRHLITQYEPTAVQEPEAEATTAAAAEPAEEPAEAPEAVQVEIAATPETTVSPDAEATVAAAPPEPAVETEAASAEAEPSEEEMSGPAAEVAPSDAADDQPQAATSAGTEEQVAESPATTPGEEPENPPAQPDPTPEEE